MAKTNRHTYDMGVIGNCAYLAYVGKDTNVSWMCWPRFDSSFVFGGLLDDKKGGEFSLLPPTDDYESHQYYIENTNVLVTEISYAEGRYRVTDFAPRFLQYERQFKPLQLFRRIEPLEGMPRLRVVVEPVGEYGSKRPELHRGSNHIRFTGLEKTLRLTTDIPLSYVEEKEYFVLTEAKHLALGYGTPLEAPLRPTSEEFLKHTIEYWQKWVKSTSIGDFCQAAVIRSALILKICQYEDTGAIIAAGTTSLPEAPGSTRNWDYRYCWLRDAYYTLTAFNNIGHFEEMERYFHFITNVTAKAEDRYQPLYTISGGTSIIEQELDLVGYMGENKPVRVGNQAYEHIQNDVYGQVLLSLLPLYTDKRFLGSEQFRTVEMVYNTLEKLAATMEQPDAGLWEFRGLAQYHTYTYLFHWAGAKAALRIGEERKDDRIVRLASMLVNQAGAKIESALDKERSVYTQAIGVPHMDASTLQLIMMHYLDPNSEQAKSHLKVIERELGTPEGLLYRYKHSDDFGAPETTFLICTFWYLEALACVGRVDEAARGLENVLKYTNHLGLLAEDVDASNGSQWGNFPQAYSHVGLVNAAYRIQKKLDRPDFY